MAVGMRKIVPAWRTGSSDCQQWVPEQSQPIAYVIESNGVRELRVNQGDHMTPRAECSRLLERTADSSQLGYQVLRNIIEHLTKK